MAPHMAWQLMLVGLGGGLGAVLRFLATKGLLAVWPDYVGAGTLVVNVLGSFAIGVVLGKPTFADEWRIFLVPGLLGGFTTFSALSYETKVLWSQAAWMGWGHLAANLIFGLLAIAAGDAFCRWADR